VNELVALFLLLAVPVLFEEAFDELLFIVEVLEDVMADVTLFNIICFSAVGRYKKVVRLVDASYACPFELYLAIMVELARLFCCIEDVAFEAAVVPPDLVMTSVARLPD